MRGSGQLGRRQAATPKHNKRPGCRLAGESAGTRLTGISTSAPDHGLGTGTQARGIDDGQHLLAGAA